jgi:hypothetical protein
VAAVNPPDFLQNAGATHNAEALRTVIGGLMAGVTAANSMKSAGGVAQLLGNALKVQATGSPSMSVDVLNGVVYVPGTEGANQGVYGCVNDATVNLAIAASNPTNPRIDIVVAKVQDTQYSGVTNSWSLAVVTGTPAGSPVAPAAPNNAIVLSRITVAANATNITNANIADARPYMATVGGRIACTSTTRPSWVGAAVGLGTVSIYETDTGRFYYWDGSIWRADSGWELIQEVAVGIAGTTITFSNIPQYFKDLRLTFLGRTSEAVSYSDILGKFNNDAGSNYASIIIQADQNTAGPSQSDPDTTTPPGFFQVAGASYNANVSGVGIAEIIGYSDATRSNKIAMVHTGVGDYGNGGHYRFRQFSWANGGAAQTPAALTRIDLIAFGGSNITVGSVARLYGWRL